MDECHNVIDTQEVALFDDTANFNMVIDWGGWMMNDNKMKNILGIEMWI